MSFAVEPATDADAAAIAEILSNWIDETDWMPRIHTREEDKAFGTFLIEKTEVDVARLAGVPVGFIAIQDSRVQALYVDGRWRGHEIGQALLERAKTRQDALELWVFQANDGARRFYGRNGFQEVELTDGSGNDEKLPDVRMIWRKAET